MGIRKRQNYLKKDKVKDIKVNQLQLEVHNTYEKDEKIKKSFKPTDDSDVRNNAYLDKKILKILGHLSFSEKDNNEFKLLSDKQSFEKVLIETAVKATNQIFYDKGLSDIFLDADNVRKGFLFVTRRKTDLKKVNDDIIQ